MLITQQIDVLKFAPNLQIIMDILMFASLIVLPIHIEIILKDSVLHNAQENLFYLPIIQPIHVYLLALQLQIILLIIKHVHVYINVQMEALLMFQQENVY